MIGTMMIVPFDENFPSPAKKKQRKFCRTLYMYLVCALIINLTNFVPLMVDTKNSTTHFVSAGPYLKNIFLFSSIAAIPLMLEFFLDTVVSTFYPAYLIRQAEHKLCHFMIILSLFLPVVLFVIKGGYDEDDYNLLICSCFISCCQSLAVGGIIGELQVFCPKHWNVRNSMGIFVLFSVSQISINMGLRRCDEQIGECEVTIGSSITSIILTILCLLVFIWCCKSHMKDIKKTISFTSNQYTSLVLILILMGYFTSRIFVVVLRMTKEIGVENFCYAGMQLHIFFALCATVLPGRMIRRGMVALKREMDSKKTFIRYISHEIRSPLSTTSLGLDYLIAQLSGQQSGGKRIEMSSADILDVVKDTKATCELATNTLNDLLMFDKIETGMLELATTEVDAWEFVNDCVKPFNLQATTSGIDLKCNYLGLNCSSAHGSESGSDLGWGVSRSMSNRSTSRLPVVDIEAQIGTQMSGSYSDNGSCSNVSVRDQFELVINVDKYKMDQVVRNFLTNALKFTPQHSTGNISIDVSVQDAFSSVEPKHGKKHRKKKTSISDRYTISDRKKVLRVTVTDNGPGISKENLPKLFGQYVQFDANTLQGGKGSGLGLWLSKAIVEMHGGVIGATSLGVGLGCSFFLEIPCTLIQHHNAHNGDGRISVSPDALNSPTIPRFNRPRVVTDLSSNLQNRNTGTEDNLSMQMHEARTPTVHFQRPRDMVTRHTNNNINSHTTSDISKEPDSSERTANNTITNTASLNIKFRPELTTQLPLADEEAIEEIFDNKSAEKSNSESKSTKKTISIRVVGNEAARRESATASVSTMSQKYQQLIENAEDVSSRDELKASLQQQTEQQSANASEKQLPRPSHVMTMRHNRVKDSPKNQEPSKRHAPTVNGSNYPLTGLRVLLVDDSSIARKMVERMLSAVGCVCDHACNGQEAVNIVADQIADSICSYDVILLDCYMPVMNGPEAVKLLRDRGFKGHILAVTGASTDGEFAPLLAEGLVERIVIKPFNAENFRQIVHELNRGSSK